MRVIVIFFAVVTVTASFKIQSKKAQPVKSIKCGPDDETPCPSGCMACGCAPEETLCPSGCCPEPNWYCCPDLMCAATADDCPFVKGFEAKKTPLLVKFAKEYPCDDGWLSCPNGFCCPWADGFCCPDDWCAQTPAECPWSDCVYCWINWRKKTLQ